MFELTLAHITAAERERDLTADLRDRRILKPAPRKVAAPRQTTPSEVRRHGR
jgi:hypothetical protein